MADILHTASVDDVDFDAIEDTIKAQKQTRYRLQSAREVHANTHADSGSESDVDVDVDVPVVVDVDAEFSMIDGKFTYAKNTLEVLAARSAGADVMEEIERMDTIYTGEPRRSRRHHKPPSISAKNWSYADVYDDIDDGDWGNLSSSTESGEKSRKPWWESDVEETSGMSSTMLNRILAQLGRLQEKIDNIDTYMNDTMPLIEDLGAKIEVLEEKIDEIREKVCYE